MFRRCRDFPGNFAGDKSGLSEELRERFQDNGIAHIRRSADLCLLIGMALSVYSALRLGAYRMDGRDWVLQRFLPLWFCNRIWSIGIPGGIYGRGVLSGGISGRSYDLLSALSLSLILQAWQSHLLFSAGLQLSYGAVADWLETERLRKVGKREKSGKRMVRERKRKRI